MNREKPFLCCALLCVLAAAGPASADDWPTYGHDSHRSAISKEVISAPLSEDWVFTPTYPPSHAWSDPQPKPVEGILELPRLRFDDAFHVAAVGELVYFGSSSDTKVYALDASTGQVRWEFVTEGPVRLAPTVWQGKLYVGSDDGKVYCLGAEDGRLIWTFDAAPGPERVLGNGKMISLWPVRTGVAVSNGAAYFGSGVFPSEGLYLYAVNAENGRLLWKNDTCGREGQFNIKTALGSLSPQGYVLLSEDKLFVPSGRRMPAVFDRKDGRFLFHPNSSFRAIGAFGGTYGLLAGDMLFTGTERILAVSQADGKLAFVEGARRLVVDTDSAYLLTGTYAVRVALDGWLSSGPQKNQLNSLKLQWDRQAGAAKWWKDAIERWEEELKQPGKTDEEKAALQKRLEQIRARLDALPEALKKIDTQMEEITKPMEKDVRWRSACDCTDSIALTPDLVFAGGENTVKALDAATGKAVWSATVNGKARGLAVANGRLLVSTDKGSVHCFVAGEGGRGLRMKPTVVEDPFPERGRAEAYTSTAEQIAKESGVKRGYGLMLGCDARLALELARRTELMIYMVEPDAEKVAAVRKALTDAGMYGGRVVVMQMQPDGLPLPDYFANLIVCRNDFSPDRTQTSAQEIVRMLKPCGGVAYVELPHGAQPSFPRDRQAGRKMIRGVKQWLKDLRETLNVLGELHTVVSPGHPWLAIRRGPLAGAGSWTHQYANAANTACSDDQIVRGPIGILWFGDPGPGRMPSRHAAAASPLAVNGRMFAQGEEVVMAYDAYNGLQLWEREIPGAMRLGVSWNGCSNLAADDGSLFVAAGSQCLRLDAATGETLRTYQVPSSEGGDDLGWVYVACADGLLYGSRGPVAGFRGGDSNCVFAMDIESGEIRWTRDGDKIMPNTICIGDGRLYFVDRTVTEEQKERGLAGIAPEARLNRLGKPIAPDVRLVVALDAATGREEWVRPQYVSDCVKISAGGGELAVMYADHVLLLCGQPLNGHFWNQFFAGEFERRSLIALDARDGRPLWSGHKGYRSRPLILNDRIIAEPWAHDLRTGAELMRTHPVTGAKARWQMSRPGHHCGSISACVNALFFRSGTAAYYDLVADYGTAHFGAQRPGCWINCIPANGLVIMPEASSGCACPYSLQCTTVYHSRKTSRTWGIFSAPEPHTPVKHLALNFGAPGDRKDSNGTLWLAYPRPRADRLAFSVELETEILESGGFTQNSADFLEIRGTDAPWVYASACTGLSRGALPLVGTGEEPGLYTVRLHFMEPVNDRRGQRVFDVRLQGRTVLRDFDILAEAGGRNRSLVREFERVEVRGDLVVELVPRVPGPTTERAPIVSGIEVLRSEIPGLKVAVGKLDEPMEPYNLGYWYADLVREQASADLALVPHEALGRGAEPFGPGKVTLGQLLARLEDRRIIRSAARGEELIRYLNTPEVMERLNPCCPGEDPSTINALYYSGLEVQYDVDAKKASYDLVPGRTYSVASVWPLRDEGQYGREKPPLEDAEQAVPVPGLEVVSKDVMARTTWDLLGRKGRVRRFEFRKRYASPAPEWEPWKKHIEAAILAREAAELEWLAKLFAKEMALPGGVEWDLVAFDDFKRPEVGPKWRSLRGKWSIKNGKLCTPGGEIGYTEKLKAPVRIEFDGRAKVPCDLSVFWGSATRGFQDGYFIGFGSNDNTRNKVLRRGREVAFNDTPMITPRRWHHVVAQALADRVQLIVDNKLILEYVDPTPVTSADTIGLYIWNASEIANIRIYTGKTKTE